MPGDAQRACVPGLSSTFASLGALELLVFMHKLMTYICRIDIYCTLNPNLFYLMKEERRQARAAEAAVLAAGTTRYEVELNGLQVDLRCCFIL